MGNRWRQENYFAYAQENFAPDALDGYADHQADLTRLVPNPAKALAVGKVAAARADMINAQTAMTDALRAATRKAGESGNGGKALVEPIAGLVLRAAQGDLQDAQKPSRNTQTHLALGEPRPGSPTLETERKLLAHAIWMSAFNSESALARLLRPHDSRGDDDARALLREAFAQSGACRSSARPCTSASTPPQHPDAAKHSPPSAPNSPTPPRATPAPT